jgi:hypothetical protein
VGNVFRKALAFDPDDRHETLMEFLTALVDAYPLDAAVRSRIEEMFRHDDHAGDIVPIRRSRPRPPMIQEAGKGTSGRSSGARASAGRGSGARPLLTSASSRKIQLDEDPTNPRATAGHDPYRERHRGSSSFFEPKTLLKWIVIIIVGGNIFWWVLDLIRR